MKMDTRATCLCLIMAICQVVQCLPECPEGSYGTHCEGRCGQCITGYCNTITGICPSRTSGRCKAGWTGKRCDEECTKGSYGIDCNKTCGQCTARYCITTTGICPLRASTCQNAWIGKRCDKECGKDKYGADCHKTCGHCRNKTNTRSCNQYRGTCPIHPSGWNCEDGYDGNECKSECTPGLYGLGCNATCGHCLGGNSSCHHLDGRCDQCEPGWKDNTCKTECSHGLYGLGCNETCGRCLEGNSSCHHVDGRCNQCEPGWNDNTCKTECTQGLYGLGCNKTCGRCLEGNSSCHHVDGRCNQCEPGWKDNTCKTECVAAEWGRNCASACNCPNRVPCNKTTGICPSGCAAGSTENLCNTKQLADDEPLLGWYIVGVIVGVVLLLSVVVVIAKRRQKKTVALIDGENPETVSESISLAYTNVSEFKTEDSVQETPIQCPSTDIQNKPKQALMPPLTSKYYNAAENSGGTHVDKLAEYIRRMKASDGLKKEYEQLPARVLSKHEVASKPENKPKNRYGNIFAYDHSRVVLEVQEGDPHSDYINASYLHGYKQENKYIAAQGPTAITINDFMRMIWEQGVGKVIMLTSLMENMKIKSEQYWPSSTTNNMVFGSITVALMEEKVYADFVIRTIKLTTAEDDGIFMVVKQYHFTGWVDHGVPPSASALLHFIEKTQLQETDLKRPILIHCSAGVGRTGTFIGLEYLIQQAKEEQLVNVPQCVREMRKQRVMMIQTQEQYEFLYKTVLEGITLNEPSVAAAQFFWVFQEMCLPDPMTGINPLERQFQMLNEMPSSLDKNNFTAALHPKNKTKNRNSNILPADGRRPFLSTPVKGCNDYINAVFIPTYKRKNAYILTQMPLPNTILDFWRLVHEQEVTTIVMLNQLPAKPNKTIGIYWGEEKDLGPFKVKTTDIVKGDNFDIRSIDMVYLKEPEKVRRIKQFQCKFGEEKSLPMVRFAPGIFALLKEIELWQQQQQCHSAPTIVHCMDGVSRGGLWCAVSSIIERLRVDTDVNILHCVKEMRRCRPEIISTLEEYQLLHELVLAYLDNFQTYSNLK